jgi:hypothetical protein
VAGSSVAGGRIWSRFSATTSAIVWLRSAAFQDVGGDLGVERDRRRAAS